MSDLPLAELLRPKALGEYVGQQHLVGEGGIITKLLANSIEGGTFPSLILWGPPGTGKTTLARIVAKELGTEFFEFSAVNASSKDIQAVIPKARGLLTPVVFIDEIHRFNKAQQDKLLPHIERGDLVFIGATTENPSFEVIGPLLSRTRVLVLNQLTTEELESILKKATEHLGVTLEKDAQDFLLQSSNGDARVLINVIGIAGQLTKEKITLADAEQALQKRQLSFDLQGEEYYNTISALHKSVRGSDPDGAIYWLARMLEAGQDPLYIARRMIRMASEDIGLADPQALLVTNAAFEACDKIGMPECNVILAEAIAYLAKAPKSNAIYNAYNEARDDVHKHGNLPVPMHIRNAPTKLMKDVGYGEGYDYYHSPKGEKKEGIEYLPEKLKGKKYLK